MLHLALPPSCQPWLPALAWYLRQNLLIFLHSPKYTDSNSRNHFQVRLHPQSTFACLLTELDVFYRCTPRPMYLCTPMDLCTPQPLPSLYYLPVSSFALVYTCSPLFLWTPVP